MIQSKATRYEKADTLVEILGTREDRTFDLFCEVLKTENSDLFDLLNKHEGENKKIKQTGFNEASEKSYLHQEQHLEFHALSFECTMHWCGIKQIVRLYDTEVEFNCHRSWFGQYGHSTIQ